MVRCDSIAILSFARTSKLETVAADVESKEQARTLGRGFESLSHHHIPRVLFRVF
jgi:hypothetical protein